MHFQRQISLNGLTGALQLYYELLDPEETVNAESPIVPATSNIAE